MKRWTARQINELSEDKLSSADKELFGNPPRRTISEYQEGMHRGAELLGQITGCRCVESLKACIDGNMSIRREIEGEERTNPLTPEEIREQDTERSKDYRRKINSRFATSRRKKTCHYGFRYFLVCYCDEDGHEKQH